MKDDVIIYILVCLTLRVCVCVFIFWKEMKANVLLYFKIYKMLNHYAIERVYLTSRKVTFQKWIGRGLHITVVFISSGSNWDASNKTETSNIVWLAL